MSNLNNKIKLLVGLGNPGVEYEYTRHNIGFLFLDLLIKKFSKFTKFKNFNNGLITKIKINNFDYVLLKPQTFMNLSGESVLRALSFYKISIDMVYVIHDDIDIEIGKIKTKTGGSSGGHNGIRNIDQKIGNRYNRIRIGVGRPENKFDVINFVVSKFSENEFEIITKTFEEILIKFNDFF